MMRFMLVSGTALLSAGLTVGSPAGPDSARGSAADVREWTVPWEGTRPRDPFVDAKGRVWFVGQSGNYVAYLEPASGRFERYEIDGGTHPHNLVVDKQGMVWFTGNRNGTIVKLDPDSRKLTTHRIPDADVTDPHTMIFDAQGNAWFTAQQSNAVGRLDARTGAIKLWRTGAGSRPYGIVTDPRGRVWLDLFGTNKLAMIDPATSALKELPLPNERSRPRRIGVTSDGRVWYTDYTLGRLGALDPGSGAVTDFALPGGGSSLPYALAIDDRDRVWVAETGVQPNRLVAFDPKRRAFTDTVEVGGGESPNTIRHMVFHPAGREIWFGTDLNTVGRVKLRDGK